MATIHLLNYAGIRADLLPGSHIHVISPDQLSSRNPDALLVLPWNLIAELRHWRGGH